MKKEILRKYHLSKMLFLASFLLPFVGLLHRKTLKSQHSTAKSYMQEAEAAKAENDLASAEAYYRKAIATDPANAEAKYNLGNLYYKKEITGQAVERHRAGCKCTEEKAIKT